MSSGLCKLTENTIRMSYSGLYTVLRQWSLLQPIHSPRDVVVKPILPGTSQFRLRTSRNWLMN